jgi:hypothetical protein
MAADLYPAFHDGVHSGHLNAVEEHLDAGVGDDGVEQVWELAVSVADHESLLDADVVEVREEVAVGLSHRAL